MHFVYLNTNVFRSILSNFSPARIKTFRLFFGRICMCYRKISHNNQLGKFLFHNANQLVHYNKSFHISNHKWYKHFNVQSTHVKTSHEE